MVTWPFDMRAARSMASPSDWSVSPVKTTAAMTPNASDETVMMVRRRLRHRLRQAITYNRGPRSIVASSAVVHGVDRLQSRRLERRERDRDADDDEQHRDR